MIDQYPPTRRPVQVPASNSSARKAAAEKAGGDSLVTALARGLLALDQHQWSVVSDFESVRSHYERMAERFLLPEIAGLATAQDTAAPEGEDACSCTPDGFLNNHCWHFPDCPRAKYDTIPAAPAAVEGVETVEWGVRLPNGRVLHTWKPPLTEEYASKEAADWAAELGRPVGIVSRTRFHIPDRVSEWTPVEPETSEPEGGDRA